MLIVIRSDKTAEPSFLYHPAIVLQKWPGPDLEPWSAHQFFKFY